METLVACYDGDSRTCLQCAYFYPPQAHDRFTMKNTSYPGYPKLFFFSFALEETPRRDHEARGKQ